MEWIAIGGGSVETVEVVTDEEGEARAIWRLGPSLGEQRLQLRIDSVCETEAWFFETGNFIEDPFGDDHEFVGFDGGRIHHPLGSNALDVGDDLVTERFTVRRLSETIGRFETTFGGAPLIVTFSWDPMGSIVVESGLTPGAGGVEGLCGRNDGSDDEANFAAEPPRDELLAPLP